MFVFLLSIITCSNAITFYLEQDKDRCFLDEYTVNTVVVGTHQLLDKHNSRNMSVELSVLDPEGAIILRKITAQEEGKFTFTTKKQGKHQICLKSLGTFSKKEAPLYFIRLKQGDKDYQSSTKESQISGLKQKITQLQKTENEFIKLQQMNRENEDKLSLENIKINDRVFKATLLQIIVIILAAVFQVWTLRKFFAKQLYY